MTTTTKTTTMSDDFDVDVDVVFIYLFSLLPGVALSHSTDLTLFKLNGMEWNNN